MPSPKTNEPEKREDKTSNEGKKTLHDIFENESQALVMSMCGPVFNRIKMYMEYPKKNCEIAAHADAKNFIALLGEQILPQWCQKNMNDADAINDMHYLLYLLAYRAHQMFHGRVIHQIIDQCWDMKAF